MTGRRLGGLAAGLLGVVALVGTSIGGSSGLLLGRPQSYSSLSATRWRQ